MRSFLARRTKLASLAAAGALVVSVLFAAGGAASAAPAPSGDVTFALPPATTPNYIFPIMPDSVTTNANLYQLQQVLYRPLYWFGQGTQPTMNPTLSLADAPVYSNDNKTVTITMKDYKWSNGEQVTASDVVFFIDLLKAEIAIWPFYVPGEFPANVTSAVATSPTKVVLTLNASYSPTWFTYNELSQITPFPHAWDKESATGAVGNYATTTAGAKLVYNYLAAQAKKLTSYASSPIWSIVDGPYKLKSFSTTGEVVYVPNPSYSGPVKSKIAQLTLEPFTTDTAEFNSLKAGTLDYGYVPYQDSNQIPLLKSQNYDNNPWIGYSINYFPLNYNNPTDGPIFRQLYFRQAIQYMVDQPVDVAKAWDNYAYPTYGPVPLKPANDLITAQEKQNPYPFNPAKSAAALKDNGWDVKAGGVTTCAKPGTGPGECGKGIAAGAKLTFDLQYASGITPLTVEMQQLKSNLASVGIVLNLSLAPFDTVIANAVPCKVGPSCSWQIEDWGGGWSYGPDYYPTGEYVFETGSGINEGSYSNPTNDANINATHIQGGTAVLAKYENYLAKQLPDIWQPVQDFQISEIKSDLKGVTQSPLLNFTPEYWSVSN